MAERIIERDGIKYVYNPDAPLAGSVSGAIVDCGPSEEGGVVGLDVRNTQGQTVRIMPDIDKKTGMMIGESFEYVLDGALKFKLTDQTFAELRAARVPDSVLAKLSHLKDRSFSSQESFVWEISGVLDRDEKNQLTPEAARQQVLIVERANPGDEDVKAVNEQFRGAFAGTLPEDRLELAHKFHKEVYLRKEARKAAALAAPKPVSVPSSREATPVPDNNGFTTTRGGIPILAPPPLDVPQLAQRELPMGMETRRPDRPVPVPAGATAPAPDVSVPEPPPPRPTPPARVPVPVPAPVAASASQPGAIGPGTPVDFLITGGGVMTVMYDFVKVDGDVLILVSDTQRGASFKPPQSIAHDIKPVTVRLPNTEGPALTTFMVFPPYEVGGFVHTVLMIDRDA